MAGFLLPLLMTAAGAGVNMYAQNKAAKRQEAAANRRYQNQMDAQRERNDELMTATEQYKPETREAAYEQAQGDATDRLMSLLDATPDEFKAPAVSTAGHTGDDYTLYRAKATAGSKDRAHKLASLLGRTGAHGDLFQQEAGTMRTAENNGMLISNFAQGQNLIDQQRYNEAGKVNPWLSVAGSALSSAGGSLW